MHHHEFVKTDSALPLPFEQKLPKLENDMAAYRQLPCRDLEARHAGDMDSKDPQHPATKLLHRQLQVACSVCCPLLNVASALSVLHAHWP